MKEPTDSPSTRPWRPHALVALALVSLAFLVYALAYVPRVANNVWGDLAFGGWTAAIGHRLAEGERIYRDFTLPLPPGSFALLSWIERASGRGAPALLHEVWVIALCQLALAWLAYAIARPLAGARTALFVAAATLAWVIQWAKELAYDPLAQVAAWGGIALLVRSWVTEGRDAERRTSLTAGLAFGCALFFKQSTAFGLLGAAITGYAWLAVVGRGGLARLGGLVAWMAGAAISVAACFAAVFAVGGSLSGFVSAVFSDASTLKGGTRLLLSRAAGHVFVDGTAVYSLAGLVAVAALTIRVLHSGEPLELGAPRDEATMHGGLHRVEVGDALGVAAVAAAAFGFGAFLLATMAPHTPAALAVSVYGETFAAHTGACLAVVFVVARVRARSASVTSRAFDATAVATLVLALAVNMSRADVALVDENNATIVVVLVALFAGLEQARVSALRWLVLAAFAFAPLATKLPRFLMAVTPAPEASFFGGMRVNAAGLEVLRAAQRARELAGADGTVLVLPEDPSLAALIGAKRPKLCGAVVFADQYPASCLAGDLTYLEHHLPRVIVTHPTSPADWIPVFRQWNAGSPAEALAMYFLRERASAYRPDSRYRTLWGVGTTDLDVWVLRDGGRAPR